MEIKQQCRGCFEGLANKSRLTIVNLLSKNQKMSVGEIVSHFKLRQPTITHHLRYLEDAGIVSSEKKGRRVFYFLSPKCKGECDVFES
jgi:DNA-binding transcriptional ArsR family regulator